ncbi:radical SAM/SPASM domain-containing protein [Alicyclobacillus sp. ALC3]|uniref:radical SAM/SPASM domain-containing protein n=1 Tax=Alicyclobacillus sp. ALC3 TaxID=2796143 RepID=UPI0023786CEB|nr:SPASM domain-containing protein [Alicyclobacillus sp. ALC3]WDL97929.1 SPASM domain-containing protein [Alicyclobacillus sp. ALC3]WDL97938.1 SPASM domain-containing protein [Alicyclobacillus sp. ALC3]
MKTSVFNHYFDVDQESFIFNAYHRGLFKVEREVIDALKALECGDAGWDSNIEDSHIDTLKKNGFIIDDDLNEHTSLMQERESVTSDKSVISLTIAPTIDCNFGCPYCFEGDDKPKLRMSEKTMRSVISFIKSMITESTHRLNITWFGGEPLLGLPQIEHLTDLIQQEILIPNQINQYSAGIITNGYGLTQKIALKLRSLGVVSAQVTLDGMPEHHDQRRFRKGGHPTFAQIVSNLKESCDILSITVRVNVDKENRNTYVPLVRKLNDEYGMKGKLYIYPAVMRDDGDVSWEQTYKSQKDYMRDKVDLHKEALVHGARVLNYPAAIRAFCGVPQANFWVIAPNGDLHKCWDTINEADQAVGNINRMEFNEQAIDKWVSWGPMMFSKCRECKVLPLCMGGCAHVAFNRENGEPECSEWKFGLHEALSVWIKEKLSGTLDESANHLIESC